MRSAREAAAAAQQRLLLSYGVDDVVHGARRSAQRLADRRQWEVRTVGAHFRRAAGVDGAAPIPWRSGARALLREHARAPRRLNGVSGVRWQRVQLSADALSVTPTLASSARWAHEHRPRPLDRVRCGPVH